MLNVLHVLDPDSAGWLNSGTLASLLSSPAEGITDHVLVVGGSEAERRVRGAGIRIAGRTGQPRRLPLMHADRLGAIARHWSPDVIHAWSTTIALASVRAVSTPRVIATLEAPIDRPAARRRDGRLRDLSRAHRLMVSNNWERERWLEAGAPLDRLTIAESQPEPCVVDRSVARRSIRAHWNVADEERVVLALADDERDVDARWTTYITAVTSVTGVPTCIVVPRRAAELERARRFVEQDPNVHTRVIVEERPANQLEPALDAIIWTSRMRRASRVGQGALTWARSTGIPIVADRLPASETALDGCEHAVLVEPNSTVRFTHALVPTLHEAGGERRAPAAAPSTGWRDRLRHEQFRAAGKPAPALA